MFLYLTGSAGGLDHANIEDYLQELYGNPGTMHHRAFGRQVKSCL